MTECSIDKTARRMIVLAMMALIFVSCTGCGSDKSTEPTRSQRIVWTKYADNPVIQPTNIITEFYAIGQPTCLIENDTIKMWYVAGGLPYITSRLLFAWSVDGSVWHKHAGGGSIMEAGESGEWDIWIDTPEIVRDGSGYKLYFFGDTLAGGTNLNPSGLAAIGVATSDDGLTWTKYAGNPVLSRGDSGSWDNSWIESPAVLYDSATDTYMMWYSGVDTTSWHIAVGLATSDDGLIWTKYAANPVLSPGPAGSYDDMWAAVPAVIKTDRGYEMWYSGMSSATGASTLTVNYATSPDGIYWTKFSGNPLFNTRTAPYSQPVDSGGPWAPDVVFDGQQYLMWYETVAGFGLATSTGEIVTQ